MKKINLKKTAAVLIAAVLTVVCVPESDNAVRVYSEENDALLCDLSSDTEVKPDCTDSAAEIVTTAISDEKTVFSEVTSETTENVTTDSAETQVYAADMEKILSPVQIVGESSAEVTYYDPFSKTTLNTSSATVIDSTNISSHTTLTSGWYVIQGTITCDTRITVSGDVNIILADDCNFTASEGISVNEVNSLTIWSGSENGNGKLNATGSGSLAGIGGDSGYNSGVIKINGGNITATGTYTGAGIGGSNGRKGTVYINGGTVNATGSHGAAIGSGDMCSGDDAGTVVINGGTVTAASTSAGAAIGGGGSSSGDVTINGGTVTATSLKDTDYYSGKSAAIGSGDDSSCTGNVTITGGTVIAKATNGSGIGGGNSGKCNVTISGGDVTATSVDGAGIGGGSSGNVNVTITGGTVNASSTTNGAGIGGGKGANATVEISGGNITATGGSEGGAGIGGGNGGVGTVTISDDITVNATGGGGASNIGNGKITYYNPIEDKTEAFAPVTVINSANITSYTKLTDGWYYIDGTITCDTRITVSGDVNIILADGCNFTASKGISVNSGNSLTIWSESKNGSGSLTATSNTNYLAGIGGNDKCVGGNITINGGQVTATGGYNAAGIGGGRYGSGGTITINGGTVTATGGSQCGAGIGGGYGADGGTITITGGTVTATAIKAAAGIGGGYKGDGGTITISGGTVEATGGDKGAGIGGGCYYNAGGNSGNITISGGDVTATGGTSGAGIGGGRNGNGENITITGGTVTATGGNNAAGIGGGYNGSGGSITINGGTVTATGDTNADDIGGGNGSSTEDNVTISGAIVNGEYAYYDPTDSTTPNKQASSVTLIDSTNISSHTTLTSGWYVIKGEFTYDTRITVSGEVNIILADDCNFTASKGISVNSGNSLTIWSESENGTGSLTATGNSYAAGIGGNKGYASGTITINGGQVTATGSSYAAGIGGGNEGVGGTITINSGTVTATGSSYAAGIGGGYKGNGGNITINGGTVEATGGTYGAGIGGGEKGAGGTITISGGTVTATGNSYAAGIGGGKGGAGGTITISGGQVTATGGNYAAGIGGGNEGVGGTITISGGTVEATGGYRGAGIGGGQEGAGGTITINGGTVEATSGQYGAGIGGGQEGAGGTITINGGTVTAKSTSYGAGIGGGYDADGGTITITSGTVTATGNDGAGIGGGYKGSGGSITINGDDTEITVTPGTGAKGIGCGRSCTENSSVTMDISKVVENNTKRYRLNLTDCTIKSGNYRIYGDNSLYVKAGSAKVKANNTPDVGKCCKWTVSNISKYTESKGQTFSFTMPENTASISVTAIDCADHDHTKLTHTESDDTSNHNETYKPIECEYCGYTPDSTASFIVTIPKQVEITDNGSSGTISATNSLGYEKTFSVTTDNSVTLNRSDNKQIKSAVTCSMTNISVADGVTTSETVTFGKPIYNDNSNAVIPAGEYTGTLTFTITLE